MSDLWSVLTRFFADRDVLGYDTDSTKYDPLPCGFLFGVACADHQVEAYDKGPPSVVGVPPPDIADIWEGDPKNELHMRGMATDFQEPKYYREDIANAAELGCKAFRFSIAWSRVERERDDFDDAYLDYYVDVINEILGHGMKPIVTLHHFTWPEHVEKRGGMIHQDFPGWFEAYTQKVVNHFGEKGLMDDIPYWVTFNEPNQLVFGYLGFRPPGWPEDEWAVDEMFRLIPNLFAAHTRARNVIKGANSDAMVGANPLVYGLPDEFQDKLDELARGFTQDQVGNQKFQREELEELTDGRMWIPILAQQLLEPLGLGLIDKWWADTKSIYLLLLTTHWWHLGMAGELHDEFYPSDREIDVVGAQDYIGLDYYWGTNWNYWDLAEAGSTGAFSLAPVWAPRLHNWLMKLTKLFDDAREKYGEGRFPKDLPLLILENGSIVDDTNQLTKIPFIPREWKIEPVSRPDYLRAHVRQVQKAIQDGANVRAYIYWSITSNHEWGHEFGDGNDFGLYHVDVDQQKPGEQWQRDPSKSLKRTPARDGVVDVYREIIRNRGVS